MKTRLIVLSFLSLPIWAADLSSVPGIENFHQVSQNVYRGAQPSDAGFHYLSSLGVKVVIDLREHDQRSLNEEKQVTTAGMKYVNVPMTGMTPPTTEEIGRILTILEDTGAGPVFVHCKRGADRTGAVIAAYRIEHDSWDNTKALQEAMTDKMSHLQFERQHYIRTFQSRPAATAAAAVVQDASAAAGTLSAKN